MKTLITIALGVSIAGSLAYAESWNAKLLDASCADKNATSLSANGIVNKQSRESLERMCAPMSNTTTFAIMTGGGHVYKLDTDGNAKAASAFQAGSFKPDDDGDVHATVVGTLQGDTVKVTSISGRGEKHTNK